MSPALSRNPSFTPRKFPVGLETGQCLQSWDDSLYYLCSSAKTGIIFQPTDQHQDKPLGVRGAATPGC